MATNIGNAAERLPESESTEEPSMEEILSSIKQIIADDEHQAKASENRENFSYPENPSNSNQSDSLADEVELSAALQAELDGFPAEDEGKATTPTVSVRESREALTAQRRGNLESRVAAVRAEFSSRSEALSPEERLQHYRARNKSKTEVVVKEKVAQPTRSSVSSSEPVISRPPLPPIQQAVSTQIITTPPPEAVAQEMASIMLKEKSDELEAMLGDMMRPTIRQWLNDNLPSLVQKLVREEIRAASRGQKAS